MTKHSRIFIMALFLVALSLGGCTNTLEGAGHDMKDMGQWMEDTF